MFWAGKLPSTWRKRLGNVLVGKFTKRRKNIKSKGNGRYILDENHNAVEVEDLMEWAKAFEISDRRVKKTRLEVSISGLLVKDRKLGFVEISTVFLGLDHSFGAKGPPILFETMVFGGEHDQYCERCSTWEAAEIMHEKVIQMVKNSE